MTSTTRTKETEKQYLKVGERLYEECLSSINLGDTWRDWEKVVWFFHEKSQAVKTSTWRNYRASICYYLEFHKLALQPPGSQLSYGDNPEPDLDLVIRLIGEIVGNPDYSLIKTSARKRKSVSYADLYDLVLYISKTRSKYSRLTCLMLICGIHVGLRPIEWLHAEIKINEAPEIKSAVLKVKNAKNTNGRANGEYRSIKIEVQSDATDSTEASLARNLEIFTVSVQSKIIDLIDDLITEISILAPKRDIETWNKVYDSARHHLHNCNLSVFKTKSKRIVFYSARHQFCADLKARGCDILTQAGLMGHYDPATATSTYGKKRSGRASSKIEVSAAKANVDNVKVTSKIGRPSRTKQPKAANQTPTMPTQN